MSNFDRSIIELVESTARNFKALPLNLGAIQGSGGGIGAPPGGYIGWLPQTRVAYDEEELATLATSVSGSLLDNLNHIRYRIEQIEAGSGVLVVDEYDGSPSVSPTDRISFSGAIVTDLGGGRALVAFSGGGGGLDTAAGDARYLKLDASNDPVTGNTSFTNGMYVEKLDNSSIVVDVYQEGGAAANAKEALYIDRISLGAGNMTAPLVHLGTFEASTGLITGPFIEARKNGNVVFEVDKDGNVDIPTGTTYNINGTPHTHAGTTETMSPFLLMGG